jgi:hypothetical protein
MKTTLTVTQDRPSRLYDKNVVVNVVIDVFVAVGLRPAGSTAPAPVRLLVRRTSYDTNVDGVIRIYIFVCLDASPRTPATSAWPVD